MRRCFRSALSFEFLVLIVAATSHSVGSGSGRPVVLQIPIRVSSNAFGYGLNTGVCKVWHQDRRESDARELVSSPAMPMPSDCLIARAVGAVG